MTILESYWVDKQYPIDGKTFHFLVGVSQCNMLNALIVVSCSMHWEKNFAITEHSADHWTAKEINGDVTYEVRRCLDRPIVGDDPFSVQDLRIPDLVPRKAGPKQLSFL